MPEFGAVRFSIDSTLSYPADEFEAEAVDSAIYTGASEADRINLRVGFLDALGTPHTVGLLENGVIDEYVLRVEPDRVVAIVRGRDPMAHALDRPFRRRYRRFPVSSTLDEVAPGAPPTGTADEVAGRFMASDVARDAVAAAGLELAWQAPDYELQEDFDADGRVIDVLQRLAEPFGQPEPFKVDVFMQGSRVIVRQRQLAPTPDPQNVFDVRDARLLSWESKKRKPLKFGRVRLEGMSLAKSFAEATTSELQGGIVVEHSEQKQFNEAGELVARTTTETSYRLPERIVIQVVRRTYDKNGLVGEEVVFNQWSDPRYDLRGSVDQPVLLSSTKTISGYEKKSKIWRVLKQELTGYEYDSQRFLRLETTRRLELDAKSGLMLERERVVRSLMDAGPQLVKETTEVYSLSRKDNRITLTTRDDRLQGGFRPGGLGKGGGLVGDQRDDVEAVVVERVFSTDPDAVDVDYSNPHLTEEQLEQIMAQYAAAHGKREVEIRAVGVTMPWLVRGSVLSFTGLKGSDGVTPIPLQPALLFDLRVEVDESTEQPSSRSSIRCVYWE